MAKIDQFYPVAAETHRIHDSVQCGYRVVSVGDERLVQLDTYGSSQRALPGKVSQSIQLDEGGAEALVRILFQSFAGLQSKVIVG